jgi:hypothetical protein
MFPNTKLIQLGLQKLIMAQLVRKFRVFYRSGRFIIVLTKPPLVGILSQINLSYTVTLHFPIYIFYSKVSLPIGFSG